MGFFLIMREKKLNCQKEILSLLAHILYFLTTVYLDFRTYVI